VGIAHQYTLILLSCLNKSKTDCTEKL